MSKHDVSSCPSCEMSTGEVEKRMCGRLNCGTVRSLSRMFCHYGNFGIVVCTTWSVVLIDVFAGTKLTNSILSEKGKS